MKTTSITSVRVTRYVHCPFSAAMEFAEQALTKHWELLLTPFRPFHKTVRLVYSSTSDASDTVRKHDALLIAWSPCGSSLFPELRAALTVRPKHRGVWLRLSSQYEPPFGRIGKFFDVVIGRFIALRTLHRFLAQLGADIEARYAWESEHNKTA